MAFLFAVKKQTFFSSLKVMKNTPYYVWLNINYKQLPREFPGIQVAKSLTPKVRICKRQSKFFIFDFIAGPLTLVNPGNLIVPPLLIWVKYNSGKSLVNESKYLSFLPELFLW